MSKLFILSSAGDTDLAKETIKRMVASGSDEPIHILALTEMAQNRIKDLPLHFSITNASLVEILGTSSVPLELSKEHTSYLNDYITSHFIDRAYVGVPSPLGENLAFQIAEGLEIPFVVAYEFMFKPEGHGLWSYAPKIAEKKLATFAVPLPSAEADLIACVPDAKVRSIGHLSIDKAMGVTGVDSADIRSKLRISDGETFVFISGTTQPHVVDCTFLDALLAELATGKYPATQLRFGIHPGVKEMPIYLNHLLEVCKKYPTTEAQCKIIVPKALDVTSFEGNRFLLQEDVNGPMASSAAEAIAQGVPGALLNEAALLGKPAYFHGEATPYLPRSLFADNLARFFSAIPRPYRCTRTELGLPELDAPARMMELMIG